MNLTIDFPVGEITPASGVSRCHGLCGDVPGGGLRPGRTAALFHSGPLVPLADYYHDCSDVTTLYYRPVGDAAGRFTLTVERDGEFADIGRVDGMPRCALARSGGFVVVTAAGASAVTYSPADSAWSVADRTPAPPPVIIGSRSAGDVWESTGAITLRKVNSNVIPDSELQALTDSLTDAYSRLVSVTSAAGLWIQPVMVRYRIYSSGNEMLYESAPVLVAPFGWQCRDAVVSKYSYADSVLAIPSLRVSAAAFRVMVTLPDAGDMGLWNGLAARIEVCVSPQFHPWDAGSRVSCRFSGSGTPDAVVSVSMSGAGAPSASLSEGIVRWLGARDSSFGPALTLTAPFVSGDNEMKCPGTERYVSSVRSVAAAAVSSGSQLSDGIVMPHGFTASAVCADGDAVVWGNVTPVLSAGYNVSEMASEVVSGRWRAVVRVTLKDGTSVTGGFAAADNRPVRFGPLVSYPHSGAVSMEVFVRDEAGQVSRAEFPLKPVAGAGLSVWIGADLRSVEMLPYDGDVPEAGLSIGNERRGVLMSASIADPLLPVSVLECSHAPVVALFPSVGSRAAWNNSRGRMTALCTDGLYRLTLDSACRILSASKIDDRGVACRGAAVSTPRGIAWVSGGALLMASGSQVRVLLAGSGFIEVAWDSGAGSLWLLDSRGNMDVYSLDRNSVYRSLAPVAVEHLYNVGARMFMTAPEGLFVPRPASGSDLRPVGWTCSALWPERGRPGAVEIGMAAAHFDGKVMLKAHNGAGVEHAVTFLSLDMDGAVNAPVCARVVMPPCRYVVIVVEGMVSPDFKLDYVVLKKCL